MSSSPNLPITGMGAGLIYAKESLNVTGQNITNNVEAIAASAGSPNVFIALVPKALGGLIAAIPDATVVGGNARGGGAVDWQTSRGTAAQVASSVYSTISGGANNIASGAGATVIGGNSNQATGNNCVAGGTNCIANASAASVALGENCTAAGSNSICMGGFSFATATGAVALGYAANASGFGGVAIGRETVANSSYGISMGNRSSTKLINGARAWQALSFSGGAVGDSQVLDLLLGARVTGATPTILVTVHQSSATPAANNVDVLGPNSARGISARVVIRNTTNGDIAVREIRGAVKQLANAAATSVVGTPTVTDLGTDASLATVAVALVANTTRGSAEIQFTGIAATNLDVICYYQSLSNGA